MAIPDEVAQDYFRACARQFGLEASDVSIVLQRENGHTGDSFARYVEGMVELESDENDAEMEVAVSLETRPDDEESPRERIEYIMEWYVEHHETME